MFGVHRGEAFEVAETISIRRKSLAFACALTITIAVSIVWHVALFAEAFEQLGVFTRMTDPIYPFGLLAWMLESAAFVIIYFQTGWSRKGVSGALQYAWLMAVFTAAASLVGTAAKADIPDLTGWFLLSGGFIALHFTVLGVMFGLLFSTSRA